MIPEGWTQIKFGEVASLRNGLNFKSEDEGYSVKIVGVGDFQDRHILNDTDDLSCVSTASEVRKEDLVNEDDLLFVRSNGNKKLIGRCMLLKPGGEKISHSGFTIRATINDKALLPLYMAQLSRTNLIKRAIRLEGGGTNISNLSQKILADLDVTIPSTDEQRSILAVLSTWDRAIKKTEALIEAKERRKKGLMQRLLTGKVRFGEFAHKDWKEVRIGELLRQVKRPVEWDDNAEYRLLSLRRASGGLFHRQTLRGDQIKTKVMNIAKAGDFLISKMQVVHGATGLTTEEFDGFHISGSYLAYVAKDPKSLNIRFFNWLCKTKQMYHKAYRSSYGVHIEKMTFNPKLWLKEIIQLPPTTEEQARIVAVLETAVAEIDEHRNQLEILRNQKRGLMQRLLTGQVRVGEPQEA